MNQRHYKVACTLQLSQQIFEVYNRSSQPISIGNWTVFRLLGAESFTFPASAVIPSFQAVQLRAGHGATLKCKSSMDICWCNRSVWSDAGDTAALVDAEGRVVQIVEQGHPFHNWPRDPSKLEPLDERRLTLMLFHLGFSDYIPQHADKDCLRTLYLLHGVPAMAQAPKRKREASVSAPSAKRRTREESRSSRPEARAGSSASPAAGTPKAERPPWVPPGTPKGDPDAWLWQQPGDLPRSSSTARKAPLSAPRSDLVSRLFWSPRHSPATGASQERPSPLPPTQLNFAERSESMLSGSSLVAETTTARAPEQTATVDQVDEVPPLIEEAPPADVPCRPPTPSSLRRRSLQTPSWEVLDTLPPSENAFCVDLVPSASMRRRTMRTPPRNLPDVLQRLPENAPSSDVASSSSALLRRGSPRGQRGYGRTAPLCVLLLAVGYLICVASRPHHVFCDSEKYGAAMLHSNCVPCEKDGFCAEGRLWACNGSAASREECVNNWGAFYWRMFTEHLKFRGMWALTAAAVATCLWWRT